VITDKEKESPRGKKERDAISSEVSAHKIMGGERRNNAKRKEGKMGAAHPFFSRKIWNRYKKEGVRRQGEKKDWEDLGKVSGIVRPDERRNRRRLVDRRL